MKNKGRIRKKPRMYLPLLNGLAYNINKFLTSFFFSLLFFLPNAIYVPKHTYSHVPRLFILLTYLLLHYQENGKGEGHGLTTIGTCDVLHTSTSVITYVEVTFSSRRLPPPPPPVFRLTADYNLHYPSACVAKQTRCSDRRKPTPLRTPFSASSPGCTTPAVAGGGVSLSLPLSIYG